MKKFLYYLYYLFHVMRGYGEANTIWFISSLHIMMFCAFINYFFPMNLSILIAAIVIGCISMFVFVTYYFKNEETMKKVISKYESKKMNKPGLYLQAYFMMFSPLVVFFILFFLIIIFRS